MTRRPLRSLLLLAVWAAAAFGQRSDLSGLRFCIDPGHGGHNAANDRHVIPDPGMDFWESESNFQKALHLDTLLRAHGAWVILTRTTNDYPNDDDPSLTARWQLANANNVHWFHSIHSNATGGTNTSVNSTLVLVKEVIATRQPRFPQAVAMSGLIYHHIRQALRTQPTGGNIAPGVYTDYTFYGGTNGGFNLGVLNGLLMPGELSEGSFHDFYPETRRLMNNDYRKMEAHAILNAFLEYFGAPPDPTGRVAGIQSEQGTGRVLNGTLVRLLPENTTVAGDALNNGFFLFDDVSPGAHTVRFETPGFLSDSVQVTVPQAAPGFADRALRPQPHPAVSFSRPAPGDSAYPASEPFRFNFSKPMDPASVQAALAILPAIGGSAQWSNGNTLLTYVPDSLMPFYQTTTITIGAGARSSGGDSLDGNGDGTGGDPFSVTFKTSAVDVIPHVVSHSPGAGDTSVAIYRSITIVFDRPMDGGSTGAALSIVPPVAGGRAWSSDSTRLTFTATGNFAAEQPYAVSLARTARSARGWPLDRQLDFDFTTAHRDTTGPRVVRQFPRDNGTDVPATMSFQARFDEPVTVATLAGRVKLVDEADSLALLGLGSVSYAEQDFRGLLSFSPVTPLLPGHRYRLTFLPGIADPLGNPTAAVMSTAFTVTSLPVPQGTVIDGFETGGLTWNGPLGESATIGVDSGRTSFDISGVKKRNGFTAGRLSYGFRDTAGGVLALHLTSPFGINAARGWFGMWIYGDDSGNRLTWHFAGLPPQDLGPLDWFGWRFVSIPLSGPVSAFQGLRISQQLPGDRIGALYFDEMQTEFATGTGEAEEVAGGFQLGQNFPNPFNPSTTIRYSVLSAGRVTLHVYDLLGRLVETLVDAHRAAGYHTEVWHGAGVASGVYIVRLNAGASSGVRKMILLR